jgi:acyl carrier protein
VTNTEKLDATFRRSLGLADDVDVGGAAYGRTDGWDSVGHMELIVGLETAFGISLDPDDVFAMSSYEAARQILSARYSIELPGA